MYGGVQAHESNPDYRTCAVMEGMVAVGGLAFAAAIPRWNGGFDFSGVGQEYWHG
jgi:hypothetical protein